MRGKFPPFFKWLIKIPQQRDDKHTVKSKDYLLVGRRHLGLGASSLDGVLRKKVGRARDHTVGIA